MFENAFQSFWHLVLLPAPGRLSRIWASYRDADKQVTAILNRDRFPQQLIQSMSMFRTHKKQILADFPCDADNVYLWKGDILLGRKGPLKKNIPYM